MKSAMLVLRDLILEEGDERLVWNWIQTNAQRFDVDTKTAPQWRARLFSHLVRAKLNQVHDGVADEAI